MLVGPWRTVVVFERVGFVPLLGHPFELFELVRLVVTVYLVSFVFELSLLVRLVSRVFELLWLVYLLVFV
jgi:hypothetical protein